MNYERERTRRLGSPKNTRWTETKLLLKAVMHAAIAAFMFVWTMLFMQSAEASSMPMDKKIAMGIALPCAILNYIMWAREAWQTRKLMRYLRTHRIFERDDKTIVIEREDRPS